MQSLKGGSVRCRGSSRKCWKQTASKTNQSDKRCCQIPAQDSIRFNAAKIDFHRSGKLLETKHSSQLQRHQRRSTKSCHPTKTMGMYLREQALGLDGCQSLEDTLPLHRVRLHQFMESELRKTQSLHPSHAVTLPRQHLMKSEAGRPEPRSPESG